MRLDGVSSFADYEEISCAVLTPESFRRKYKPPINFLKINSIPNYKLAVQHRNQEDFLQQNDLAENYHFIVLVLNTNEPRETQDLILTIFLQTIFVKNPVATTYHVMLNNEPATDDNQPHTAIAENPPPPTKLNTLKNLNITVNSFSDSLKFAKIIEGICVKIKGDRSAAVAKITTIEQVQAYFTTISEATVYDLTTKKERALSLLEKIVVAHEDNKPLLLEIYNELQNALDRNENSCFAFIAKDRHPSIWLHYKENQKTATYQKMSNILAQALIQAEYRHYEQQKNSADFRADSLILQLSEKTHSRYCPLFRAAPPAKKWVDSVRDNLTTEVEKRNFDKQFLRLEDTDYDPRSLPQSRF